MAFTYEQKFNGLNDGDLNGQDSWSGDVDFDIQNIIKYEGSKGVKLAKSVSGENIIRDSMPQSSDGIMYIAVKISVIDNNGINIRLREGGNTRMAFRLFEGGVIDYQVSGGGYTTYGNYNADQWYVLAIEWDNSGHINQFRLKVHNGIYWESWTPWRTSNSNFSYIDGMQIICYGDDSYNAYFDTITPTDPTTDIYPERIYSPREKSNRSGIIYDPLKKTVIFVEDISKLDDEVVAIENTLGENPQGAFDDVADFLTAIVVSLGNKMEHVSDDTSPTLGGELDADGNNIIGVSKIALGTDTPDDTYQEYIEDSTFAGQRWCRVGGADMILGAGLNFAFIGSKNDKEVRYIQNDIPRLILDGNNLYFGSNLAGGAGTAPTNATLNFRIDGDADKIYLGDGGQDHFTQFAGNGNQSFHGSARISWTKITADSVTLDEGTSSDSVADLRVAHDGDCYDVAEVSGIPGIDLKVDFVDVLAFNWVQIIGFYDGSASHSVSIELYNWDTEAWDMFDSHDGVEETMRDHSFFVPNDTDYIGTGDDEGDVRVRFYHTQTGIPSHDLCLDVVALYQ